MLAIYNTMLDVIRRMQPVIVRIEGCDRDLGRQLKRAASSVALNISEGSGSSGGTRRERYRNALGSARETTACLDVAVQLGYVEVVDERTLDLLDRVRATLVKVAR
jgi:four helix bundle protein